MKAITLVLAVAFALLPALEAAAPGEKPRFAKRWLYVSTNLYVNENVAELETLLTRAARAGYNGVLFADYKTLTWWTLSAAERWRTNAGRVRELTRKLGLELVVAVFPFGYSSSLLSHDVDLAAGMPVRDAPLRLLNDRTLVPEVTARIENGSFEDHRGHAVTGFAFQDDPGKSSFIDREIVKHGEVSLRFQDVGRANRHGHGRICQEISVLPWQQYRIRVWMRAERLTADELKVMVMGGRRVLQYQYPVVPAGKRFRHVGSPRDLSCEWIEQSVTVNSLDHEKVRVYIGVWGGKTGKIWWDDLRIDAVPTLNLLRRESLPITLKSGGGRTFVEGKDYERIEDEKRGVAPWPGNYDTRHEPPVIRVKAPARFRGVSTLLFSGWHPALVHAAQVSASLTEPKVFELCALQVRKAREALDPDGYFMLHDEIRSAGWEPDAKRRTSGERLAANVSRCYGIARKEGGGKPVYVWSDMFDPNHNARAGYYLVANTFEGSWEGLDPKVTVMKWGGGARARPGLEFFAGRGHAQMIAAFYDGDVKADHAMWTDASEGVKGVGGVMYTTWRRDYSKLEEFARTWWGAK